VSGSQALKRDSRLGTYFEYDLSKMVNTKGGFLMDDGKKEDEELRRKELEREKQRNVHNLDMRAHLSMLNLLECADLSSISHVPRSCTQSKVSRV
jgi:DNA-repair protein complementing XP-A cells